LLLFSVIVPSYNRPSQLQNICLPSQLIAEYLYSRFNLNIHQMQFFTSNNLAVQGCYFHATGGFSETFSIGGEDQDREFCYRWTRYGLRMIYASEIQIYHFHDLSFSSFLRQHFNYGVGAFIFRKIVAILEGDSMRIENPLFYFDLFRYALSRAHGMKALTVGALVGYSQFATLLGYVSKWLESQRT
jgi:hypothetical protein